MRYNNLLWFGLGTLLGSGVTYVMTSNKYTKIMEEEISEIRKYYKTKDADESKDSVQQEEICDSNKNAEFKQYSELIQDYSPTNYIDDDKDVEEEGYVTIVESRDYTNGVKFDEVKQIEHYDFGEEPLYDTETFIIYADGVVINEDDEQVVDIEELIGVEALRWLKESDDQSIFVRNDVMRTDYELIKDDFNYSDLVDK